MVVKPQQQFETLLLEVFNPLYTFALGLTRDPEEARDLVQEGCLRAYSRFHQFRPGTNFKAWIFTIVRRLYINAYNRRKAMGSDGRSLEELEDRLEAPQAEPSPHSGDDWWFGQLMHEEVWAALRSLPEEFRTAVILSDCEGFRYDEIAQVLGCPLGTVRSRIHRGRRWLRNRLMDFAQREGYVSSRPQTA